MINMNHYKKELIAEYISKSLRQRAMFCGTQRSLNALADLMIIDDASDRVVIAAAMAAIRAVRAIHHSLNSKN